MNFLVAARVFYALYEMLQRAEKDKTTINLLHFYVIALDPLFRCSLC